jgi:hypothetical protein
MVLAGVLNGVPHPSSQQSPPSSSSVPSSAPTRSRSTLVYTAVPDEPATWRSSWERTCRPVTLKALHRHARWWDGRTVRLHGVVDFVYDEPDGSYWIFPHMRAPTYLVVSRGYETNAQADQVVIVFSRHARGMIQGDPITVWGTAQGRVTMNITGGHLSVPWVKARYVVGSW